MGRSITNWNDYKILRKVRTINGIDRVEFQLFINGAPRGTITLPLNDSNYLLSNGPDEGAYPNRYISTTSFNNVEGVTAYFDNVRAVYKDRIK